MPTAFSSIKRNHAGFTLVELLVVIAIIGIMSTFGVVTFSGAQAKARDADRKSDLRNIQNALQLYYQDNNRYPVSDWVYGSSGGFWINDNGTTAGSRKPLNESYIKEMPHDPINNGGSPWDANPGYNYAYYSGNWGSCVGGQYYILTTKLENKSDSQANKAVTFGSSCPNSWGGTSGGNSFPADRNVYTVSNP